VGLFWDLIQQSQIDQHARQATTLEERVRDLEREMDDMRRLLGALLHRLEEQIGEDLDRDGRIG
jgi:hypothetical protein